MSHTTPANHQPPKGGRPSRRAVQKTTDRAYAIKLQAEEDKITEVRARSNTNNSRNKNKTTRRQSNTSNNNDTTKQTISKSSRKSGDSIATRSTTSIQNNNFDDGTPSSKYETPPLDINTTTNNNKHHQTIPTSRSIIANDTTTSTTSPFVFDSASRSEPNKSLLTNSTSKGGTSALPPNKRKRVLNEDDVKKKSTTTTASGGGGSGFTRRRRAAISTTTHHQVSTTSTSNYYASSQHNNDTSPSMAQPFSPLSTNKGKGIMGRGKSRRGTVGKTVLFSSPARASTIGNNDMLGRSCRKRKVRDDDDGSVIRGTKSGSDMSIRNDVWTECDICKKWRRAETPSDIKLMSRLEKEDTATCQMFGRRCEEQCDDKKEKEICAKENKKRQKMDDNVPNLPNEKESEDTNINVGDAPFGISGALLTEGSSTSKRKDLEVVAKSRGKKKDSDENGEWLPQTKKKATRTSKRKKANANKKAQPKKAGSNNSGKKKEKRVSRKDTAASCVASDVSQANMALSKFSPPPEVYESYDTIAEVELEIKTRRLTTDIDSNEKKQQIQVLEMKKLALLVQHLTLLLQVMPTEQERKTVMELNEKDAELRNKGRSKPLKDHEKKRVEAVSSWNNNVLYTLCSSKRSIIDLQKSGLQSVEFTKLQQSIVEMEESVYEATKAMSSVTTDSTHLFVKRLQKKGYNPLVVEAMDKLMSSKSSRREHDYKGILREKSFLAESVLESRATDNQMTGKSLAAEFNILEDKHEVANDKVVVVDGYYEDEEGNEVSPEDAEDATMVVAPGTAFQYNPMSGVAEHQTSISFLHWHSGWDESEDDESKPEKSKPKKPKRKRSKAEVLARGCITALTDMDTALLHLEAGGGDMTLNQRTQMKEGLAVFDLYSFISDIKENWEIEKMLYGRIVDMSDIELMLDGIIRGEVQCLVNELNGEQSRVGVFSAEGSRQCWSILGASGSRDCITVTDMPHGQPQSCPKIMMAENLYSSGDLFDYSAGLGILHTINECINVSSTSKSMFTIAEREEMTAEMQAERYQALKQQLSDNARKAWKTNINNLTGIPRFCLAQCVANDIEGATIHNAVSLYMAWQWENGTSGLYQYINDQSAAGKAKRKQRSEQAFKTCIQKEKGIPAFCLAQCVANDIEGATIHNAVSLYWAWEWKNGTSGIYQFVHDQSAAGKAKRLKAAKKAHANVITGSITTTSSGNFTAVLSFSNEKFSVGTYTSRKIAERAKSTAARVLKNAPDDEDVDSVVKRAKSSVTDLGLETSLAEKKRIKAEAPKGEPRIDATATLKAWLLSPENYTNPHPKPQEKLLLMQKTGMDATQLNTWFGNARRSNWFKTGKKGSSLPRGVSKQEAGNYRVIIWYQGKDRSIGTFQTLEQATLANEIARGVLKKDKGLKLSAEESERNFKLAKEAALKKVSKSK